jgi:hypothetical protein
MIIMREIFFDTIAGILRLFGVDKAVGYGMLARVWGLFAGLLTMFIIAARFSKEQQGFYYTFSSLLTLQIFFELGLMYVVATFVSHEFAGLQWGERGDIVGDTVARERVIDLLAKSTKWFGIASFFLIVGLIPAGLFFLSWGQSIPRDFAWRLPWVLAVVATALNLMITPFFAMIMGSGDVITVNQRELMGIVIGTCLSWVVIVFDGGLYAVGTVLVGNILSAWPYLLRRKPVLLKLVWDGIFHQASRGGRTETVSWGSEIWPMQWKIALSWVSGYFIFQLFNPMLFHYHGAAVAGQMGMTLSAANALVAVSLTLMVAKSPEFGKLIALREWGRLDRLFGKISVQSAAIAVLGGCAGWGAIWLLQAHYTIGQRFLPHPQVALLFASFGIQVIIQGFAIYLRAHKQEPFLVSTVVISLLQGASTWYLGKRYSSMGITAGFLLINLFVSLPLAYAIWKKCKKTWH